MKKESKIEMIKEGLLYNKGAHVHGVFMKE